MKPRNGFLFAIGCVVIAMAVLPARAQLYSEDFDVDHSANWVVNNGPSDEAHNFFFDYSTVGIPPAPNSVGGTTRGMKLQSNLSNGIFSGMSVSPVNLNLPGSIKIEFDLWANAPGPFPAGGSGSTNLSTFGVATSGTYANWPGRADCIWFAATGEGGSSFDYRAYSPAAVVSYQDGDPVYAPALIRNCTDPYYLNYFVGATPPAAQTALFPQQTGAVQNGAIGMTWRRGKITKSGSVVKGYIDDLLIATVDTTGMTLGGNNIMFGHSDINATSSADPNDADLLFTLVDNIIVEGFLGPPNILTQPQSQTVTAGQDATFTVNAVSNLPGQPNLHYQWQTTFDDVTTNVGTDAPTLTIPSVMYAISGTIVRVIVTDEGNPPGSTTSSAAVLTVAPLPCNDPYADVDDDGDVDMDDFAEFQKCVTPNATFDRGFCGCFDRDVDDDVDHGDFLAFQECASGATVTADPLCDNYSTGDVVINEFQYDDYNDTQDDREFVELYNRSASPVDISSWVLRAPTMAKKDIMIPGGPDSGTTIIPPNGYYVIGSASVANVSLVPGTGLDLWENDREVLELVDPNGDVKDTVTYERYAGAATGVTNPEGAIWGEFGSVDGLDQMSWSRWLDGADTNDNGRDFGMRRETPGASNLGTGAVVAAYVPPDVNGLTAGTAVSGLLGSFVGGLVIDPADTTTLLGTDDVNPNVIPVSPQGGNCIVAWDPAGGGNMVVSNDIMTGNASYDLWVYFDTSDITVAGAESTAYGIMGTTDYVFNFPDPGGTLFPTTNVNSNGSTGLAWVYNKDNAGQVKRLFLVDAKGGGDSSPNGGSMDWTVHQTIDMSTVASGWYRLSISYTSDGSVTAIFNTQTFNFTTAAGLKGAFYVGYRESLAATPASLRPPTFDRAQ